MLNWSRGRTRSQKYLMLGASIGALFAADGILAMAAAQTDEIVVTATRRASDIQDVPIAVSAMPAEQLEKAGVDDIRDISILSPSVNFINSQSSSTTTSIRIRGVGTVGNNPGFESSVGIFIDGVYQPRPGIALGEFVDVASVEILRGPQGTLFGRNTSVGALVVKSAAPHFDGVDGQVSATVGNYDLVNLQGAINAPLSDQLAVRFAGSVRKRNGVLENELVGADPNDVDRFLLRGQALWQPTDGFSVRLIADYADSKENCCGAIILEETAFAPFFPLAGLTPIAGVSRVGESAFDDRISNTEGRFESTESWGVNAEVNWDFDAAKLTYILAYRDFQSNYYGDSDFTNLDFLVIPENEPALTTLTNFTQEVRLQGLVFDDRLDWLVGAFYSDEEVVDQNNFHVGADGQKLVNTDAFAAIVGFYGLDPFTFGPDPVATFTQGVPMEGMFATNKLFQTTESWSLFTHNIFELAPGLFLTAGARYVDEVREGGLDQVAFESQACLNTLQTVGAIQNGLVPLPPGIGPEEAGGALSAFVALICNPAFTQTGLVPGGPSEFDETFEDDTFTYTFNGRYEFTDSFSAYVSFTHGYKSGGINLAVTGSSDDTGSQVFEAEIVDSYELGLRSHIFGGRTRANMTIFHMDVTDFQLLTFTGTEFLVFNVPNVKSTGVELETQTRLGDFTGVNLSYVYTDARYTDDCDGGVENALVSRLCGYQLPNAPAHVVVGGISQEVPIGMNYMLTLSPLLRYESKSKPAPDLPDFDQDSSTFLDFRVAFGDRDGAWALELWGKNMLDERTQSRTFFVPYRGVNDANGNFAAQGAFVVEPRTYGASVRVKF